MGGDQNWTRAGRGILKVATIRTTWSGFAVPPRPHRGHLGLRKRIDTFTLEETRRTC